MNNLLGFSGQPIDTYGKIGNNIALSCEVVGDKEAIITWMFEDVTRAVATKADEKRVSYFKIFPLSPFAFS